MSEPQIEAIAPEKELTDAEKLGFKKLPTDTDETVIKTTPKESLDIRQTLGKADIIPVVAGQPEAVEKVVEKFTPSIIPGVMDKVDRKVFVDQRKVAPYIDVRSVLNPTDNSEIKEAIMSLKGYKSESPNAPKGTYLPFVAKDYDGRIAEMNKGQATHLIDSQDQAEPIPFEIGLAQYLKAPKDYEPLTVFGIPVAQKIQELTGFPLDEVGGKLVYINRLNKKLKDLGVSTRSRYGIIKYRLQKEPGAFDSKVLEPAFNDYANAAGYIRNGVRSVIEAPLFIAGEVFDAINQEYDKTNLSPIGEGFEIEDPFGETLIESSEGRDELLEDFLPAQSSVIQDHFAQLGIVVDLPTSQALASDFSNLPTRLAGVAGEMLIPASYLTKVEKLYGKAEIANFRHFSIKQKKLNPKITPDDILDKYQTMRSKQIAGFDLVSPVFELPFIGGVGKKINGYINAGRLASGMDIRQAGMAMRGRNPAILENSKRIEQQKQDIISFKASRPDDMSYQDTKKLELMEADLEKEIIDHRALVHREHIPKFVRDIAGQNKYMIIGAAAGGQLAENTNSDAKIFELVGLATGLVYGQTRTFRGTMNWFKRNIRTGSLERGKTFDLAEQMARNINTFSPEFRDALLSRIRYFENMQQRLIKSGVNEDLVKRSFSRITGLTVLQTLEEAERLNINTKDLRTFSNLQNLQELSSEKEALIAELRSASISLSNLPAGTKSEGVVAEFYNIIETATDMADGRLQKLRADTETVEKLLPIRVNAMIKENNGTYLAGSGDEKLQLKDALEYLYDNGVKEVDLENIANSTKKIMDTSDTVSTAVNTAIKKINGEYNLQDALAQTRKVVTGLDKRVKIVGEQKGIPTFKRAGNLTAVLLENSKNRSYNLARANYKILDKAEFLTKNGTPIGRNAKTSANDIVSSLFKNMDVIDIQDFGDKGIGRSKRARLLNALEGIGDSTFQRIQQGTGAESINEVVESVLATARDEGFDLTKGLSRKMQALQYISEKKNVSTIDVNFDQLNELKHSVNRLLYKAKSSGDATKESAFAQLMGNVKERFNFFRTEDGKNVGQLFIKDGDRRVPVKAFLEEGDAKYSDHMDRFYGNDVIAGWLGLGKKGGRKNRVPNQDFPVGVKYANNPVTWFDMDEIANMDRATKGLDFNQKINQGFGTFNEKLGVHRIDISTEDGKAVQKALELKGAEWLISQYRDGKLNYNQLKDKIDNIQANLKGVDANGKEVSLINLNKIIDDKLSYAPSNIKKEIYTEGEAIADRFVEKQVSVVKTQSKDVQRGITAATDIIKAFTANKIDSKNILEGLLGGGTMRLNSIKNSLIKNGIAKEKVDEVLENLLLTQLDNTVFEKTGRMSLIGGAKNAKMIPEYNMNIDQLKDLIGFSDPTKADAVKGIIGESKYQFYTDMIGFLENESIRTIKNANFTGVPKNLSIESYISRFYSINRGVISARYVGTEAVLQQFRLKNHSMFKALLLDREAGDLFLKMVKSGKPLELNDEKRFFNLMGTALAKAINTNEEQASKVTIDLGNSHQFGITEYQLARDPRIPSAYEGIRDPLKERFQEKQFLFDEQGRQIVDGR